MHPTAARLAKRLQQRGLQIEVRRLSDSARTAALAAAALDVEVGQIVKSLVFLRKGEPVMVLCAGDRRVDAERLGLSPVTADRVREVTGFSIGGIPPLGHDIELATTIDESLRRFDIVYVPKTGLAQVDVFMTQLRNALPVQFSYAFGGVSPF